MEPQILVLDEPSAGLDPRARRGLINLLHEMPLTMLVSTHDLAMARDVFPRMVIMDNGCIVADGLTAELMKDEKLLTEHGLEKL
jgi:cobalt/nickel transport system ATP-binding protein